MQSSRFHDAVARNVWKRLGFAKRDSYVVGVSGLTAPSCYQVRSVSTRFVLMSLESSLLSQIKVP